MDALETIMTRRSVRSFTREDVDPDAVETLLKAAMAAPSAGNEQPWHFVVIRNREALDSITQVHSYASMLKEASLCICVLGEKALEKHEGMMPQDLSAATQNILLAARAIGLGSCWCGVHPRPEREEGMAELLGLPPGIVCFSIIAVGHPAVEQGQADRFQPARVHEERW